MTEETELKEPLDPQKSELPEEAEDFKSVVVEDEAIAVEEIQED